MKALILALLCLPMFASASECSFMGGLFFGRTPTTGTYWNSNNDKYVANMTPAAVGARCDTDQSPDGYSYGAQLTNFTASGPLRIDAMAVSSDAPYADGYNPATGTCASTCAALARFRVQTEINFSLTFLTTKHWGSWSAEIGANVYETKTSGVVTGAWIGYYKYPDTTYLGIMPMLGGAYRLGAWSLHGQVWWMPSPGDVPGAMTEDAQFTVLASRSFKAF